MCAIISPSSSLDPYSVSLIRVSVPFSFCHCLFHLVTSLNCTLTISHLPCSLIVSRFFHQTPHSPFPMFHILHVMTLRHIATPPLIPKSVPLSILYLLIY